MGKLNFDIDEASLLKTYGLSTLAPTYVVLNAWRLAVTERWTTVSGKISIMNWGSHLEALWYPTVIPQIRWASEEHQSALIISRVTSGADPV